MKPFNKLLHDDILLLKGIDREKLPDEYRQVFINIMKRYKISRSTVYAELAKSMPGAYNKFNGTSRFIVVTKNELRMVKEMLGSGKSMRYIKREMSLELGFRYTHYRIYKVKEMLLSGSDFSESEHVLESCASDASKELLDPDARIEPVTPSEPVEFKGNISRFFQRLSMLSLIDPERKLKIKVSGITYKVNSRVIKDCLQHITISANSGGKTIDELCRFDMETILARELARVKRGNDVSPAAVRQFESIRKSLLNSSAAGSETASLTGGYTLDDIYRAVRHFAPAISRDDVAKFMSTSEIL